MVKLQQQQSQSLQCGTTTFNKLSFDPATKLSLLPSAKLTNILLENIIGSNDICYQVKHHIPPKIKHSFTTFQQLITTCLNCTKCSSSLANIYRYLHEILKDVKVSLIVVIRGVNHRQINDINEEKKVRFAFIEDDAPLSLDDCQIIDGNEGDAFRYAHAKDRLQRRLFNAAKKALTRIPTRQLRQDDKDLDSDCPVCIDPYRSGDLVRCLPCRHVFHKMCVDPWLLEHRTCPMCKSDILKAFGYHVSLNRRTPVNNQIEESQVVANDRLNVDVHSTGSESIFPFTNHNDLQEPFSFTPSVSSQLVQQVMHSSNASAFSIIPLTVHNVPLSTSRNLQTSIQRGNFLSLIL
ncbi:unnamed protein product [Dracunculus medinensis]|uniref:RING-type domain-containing protein n=1 Tax=Dracunculus medinensis TaxID=318479 RepID=A0A0N4U2B6_DRAME|nr:unnamed protein product [Dracunculus medinensis]